MISNQLDLVKGKLKMLLTYFSLFIFIRLVLVFINTFICIKTIASREKYRIFECGFDPKTIARVPFSLHFFIIALIFLIFDIEIILLIPFPLNLIKSYEAQWFYLFFVFILVLLLGVLVEWKEGSLDWVF